MKNIFIGVMILLITGCAATPQAPVSLDDGFHSEQNRKVGIVVSDLPESDVYLPGADCLLCIAAAEAMNSSLSKHATGLTDDSFPELRLILEQRLEERGMEVTHINGNFKDFKFPKVKSEESKVAKFDFSSLKSKYDITHLFVVDIAQVGFHRSYSAYIPTSDPRAYVQGRSFLVDLEDGTYEWYLPIKIYRGAHGEWDEPPVFPSLTNAYYESIETGKERILKPFSN